MKNREHAQSGLKWASPKGGLQFGARPGGKELLGKNHEAASVSWTGRANPPNLAGKVFFPGRGDRPVTPSARRILRKPVEPSWRRASRADAFYPEAPCPRDPTEASRNCQTVKVPPQSRGFTIMKLSFYRELFKAKGQEKMSNGNERCPMVNARSSRFDVPRSMFNVLSSPQPCTHSFD